MKFALEEKMDQQRIEDIAADTAGKAGKAASETVTQTAGFVQGKLDQGKAVVQDLQTNAATLARQASEAGRQAAAQAGEAIQSAAREAGNQANRAASNLYQQGTYAGEYVGRYVAEQPLTALLIAGAIGYGLAYLIHRR
jgi:ElaB/YqjD/DUF883 family membrane-anchored ribosome-binding protein